MALSEPKSLKDKNWERKKKEKKKKEIKSRKTTKTKQTSNSALSSSSKSVLDLPPELRNIIYHMVLTLPCGYGLRAKKKNFRRVLQSAPLSIHYDKESVSFEYNRNRAGMLRVNKQIRAEATEILYSQHFHFFTPTALSTFLWQIGPTNKSFLRDITLHQWPTNTNRAENEQLLNAFGHLVQNVTTLESFTILDNSLEYNRTITTPEHLFEIAHPLLEAVYAAKGEAAALNLIRISDEVLFAPLSNSLSPRRTEFNSKLVELFRRKRGAGNRSVGQK